MIWARPLKVVTSIFLALVSGTGVLSGPEADEDGVLWGRGTLDTKVTFNGIFSAANYLISKGFQPENDIYFAFSGGEEVNGQGAPNIVQYFIDHHVQPAIVVDEGGAVVENV
ncbi:MAG: M20/M25/M40 family metallo-hydrolase, partial [Bacteroidales bacterium]|nr:M20/M25/M40 family metallo-hydrolase [Bacteroidales bacterium]